MSRLLPNVASSRTGIAARRCWACESGATAAILSEVAVSAARACVSDTSGASRARAVRRPRSNEADSSGASRSGR